MVVDLQARQQALNPEASFIVQAPAGSGKTGLLVYRYLTLLSRVEKPQNVLAITFTRKARAEMRERIIELLMAAQAGHKASDAFEQQGITLAERVLARDAQSQWRLLDAPHQMQILTIDAFSSRLAASMPWLSRLGDRPNTTDAAQSHYDVAVDQLLNELLGNNTELAGALQTVMHELDFNYAKARRLFSSMLAKRDQWLRHLVQQDMPSIRIELERAWQDLSDEAISNLSLLLPEHTVQTLLDTVVGAAQRIDFDSPRAAKELRVFANFTGTIRDLSLAHWQGLVAFLMVKSGDKIRARLDKNIGFPDKNKAKEDAMTLLAEFADDTDLIHALANVNDVPPVRFSDADWQCLLALETVLKALAARLQLRFRAAGECDHSEVSQRANMALAELNNPTDLGLLMDGQIQHILVDEFQDTSNAQIELLKKLTSGWVPTEAAPKTLFLVGDPMQSIYRFREADVSLFLQVANNATTKVFENVQITPLALSQNFRSSEMLVAWFNEVFSKSFPKDDAVLTGAIRYAQAHSSKSGSSLPPVDCVLASSRDQEAQALISQVKEGLKNLPDETAQIAILVRSRAHLERLLPLLDRNNIPYTAVDIQPLHQQQAIKDMISLCQAICREDDRIAWLALLRGPWCGLSLNDIHAVSRDSQQTIWRQLNEPANQATLSADSVQRLQRFVSIMHAARKQYQQVDLGSLTYWAWQQLGGDSTLMQPQMETQLDDIRQTVDVLNQVQRGGDLPSYKELQSALEKMRAKNVQSQQAKVVISTIHKSKGLQYHTVILPSLASKGKSGDRDVLMWAEHQGRYGETNLLMAPLLFNPDKGSHYDYLRKLDSVRANHEIMRLMYVACTRAEARLVLLATAKLNDKTGEIGKVESSSLLASVWPALEDKFELMPAEPHLDDVRELEPNQTLRRVPFDYTADLGENFAWQPVKQLNTSADPVDEAQVTYDWATQVATAVGIALHDFLQHAGDNILTVEVNNTLTQRWRAELLALRVPDNQVEYALKRLMTAVRNIQQDTQAHFIFADYPVAQNEYALSTLENGVVNQYRLDRTFVDHDNTRWIVDYKSTITKNQDVESFVDQQVAERHREQLNKYGALMQAIDKRPIKLAVYFPLLKQLRIWDYEPNR